MTYPRALSARPWLIVDQRNRKIQDPVTGDYLGLPGPWDRRRMMLSLETDRANGGYLRYSPSIPVNEAYEIWMDFSQVIPRHVGIATAWVGAWTNTVTPQTTTDFVFGTVEIVDGRQVRASITGGKDSDDYQIRWTVTDTRGNVFVRTALLLCSNTT
jgi:hypothetical protein